MTLLNRFCRAAGSKKLGGGRIASASHQVAAIAPRLPHRENPHPVVQRPARGANPGARRRRTTRRSVTRCPCALQAGGAASRRIRDRPPGSRDARSESDRHAERLALHDTSPGCQPAGQLAEEASFGSGSLQWITGTRWTARQRFDAVRGRHAGRGRAPDERADPQPTAMQAGASYQWRSSVMACDTVMGGAQRNRSACDRADRFAVSATNPVSSVLTERRVA